MAFPMRPVIVDGDILMNKDLSVDARFIYAVVEAATFRQENVEFEVEDIVEWSGLDKERVEKASEELKQAKIWADGPEDLEQEPENEQPEIVRIPGAKVFVVNAEDLGLDLE